jgi:hypothetical protein
MNEHSWVGPLIYPCVYIHSGWAVSLLLCIQGREYWVEPRHIIPSDTRYYRGPQLNIYFTAWEKVIFLSTFVVSTPPPPSLSLLFPSMTGKE